MARSPAMTTVNIVALRETILQNGGAVVLFQGVLRRSAEGNGLDPIYTVFGESSFRRCDGLGPPVGGATVCRRRSGADNAPLDSIPVT